MGPTSVKGVYQIGAARNSPLTRRESLEEQVAGLVGTGQGVRGEGIRYLFFLLSNSINARFGT